MTHQEIVDKIKVGDYIYTTNSLLRKDKEKARVKVMIVDNSKVNRMTLAVGEDGFWLSNTEVFLYKQIHLGGE